MTAAYSAYQRTQNVAEDPRSVEYRLLGQVTAYMIEASRDKLSMKTKVVEAALWNRRMWAAFKVDLLSPANALPEQLKAKLISIALWVERETAQILSFRTDLSAVINVNKAIMEGLRPVAHAPVAAAPERPAGSLLSANAA